MKQRSKSVFRPHRPNGRASCGFARTITAIAFLALIGAAPVSAQSQSREDKPPASAVISIVPQIIIRDESPFWDEKRATWQFTARISLYNPPVISRPTVVRPAPGDDGSRAKGDGRETGGGAPVLEPPPLPLPAPPATRRSDPVVERVTVRYARHLFPDAGAHTALALIETLLPGTGAPQSGDDEEFEPPVPPGLGEGEDEPPARETQATLYENTIAEATPGLREMSSAQRGDSLFYEWVVTWRDRQGQQQTTTSARQRLVIGCTDADTLRDLMRLQRRALVYEREQGGIGSFDANGLPNDQGTGELTRDGVDLPAHFAATIEGNGFTLASRAAAHNRPTNMGGLDDPATDITGEIGVAFPPSLVFYQPNRESNESRAVYRDRISDWAGGDPPYEMIGFGFAQPHLSATRRPGLGCVPSENWFIHEAGWHLADGGFRPTPPRETVRGSVLRPPGTPLTGTDVDRFGDFQWHGRIWDMHFFFDPACPDRSCPPIISIFAPFDVPGLPLAEPLFFKSEVFE